MRGRTIATFVATTVGAGALLSTSDASAAGFAVAEQGAASVGTAGAVTGRPAHPDAAYFNPAALGPGLTASLGVALVAPRLAHEANGTRTPALGGVETPPSLNAGFSHEIGKHRFGASVSGNVPFGASLAWPPGWPGRFEVTSIALQVFEGSSNAMYGLCFAPGVARCHGAFVALAGGVRFARSTVELQRKMDVVDHTAEVALGGAANGWSWGASGIGGWGPVSVGVSYRAPMVLSFSGSAHFEDVPIELSGAAHDQPIATELTLPSRLAVGIAVQVGAGTGSLDVERFGWSAFDTFDVDFQDEATPDVSEPRDWHDTLAVRTGWEQRLMKRRLALRGGLAFDPTPAIAETLSPTLPDASRIVATVGVGWKLGFGFSVDGALAHVQLLGAEARGDEAFPGRYGGTAEIATLGLRYGGD